LYADRWVVSRQAAVRWWSENVLSERVVAVVAEFVANGQEQHQAAGQAERQPDNVDECVAPVAPEGAQGGGKITFKHGVTS
jgi:hypothetical protein